MQLEYTFYTKRALTKGPPYRGPVMIPWPHLLIRIRGLKHQVIPMPGTDYLKACGQAIFGKTRWHGSGGMPG